MANEIAVTCRLAMNMDGVNTVAENAFSLSPTTSQRYMGIQDIGTSDTEIFFPSELITAGVSYIFLKNLDSTNDLVIKINVSGTKHSFARIKPGKSMLIPSSKAATMAQELYAAASAGTVKLQIHAVGIVS